MLIQTELEEHPIINLTEWVLSLHILLGVQFNRYAVFFDWAVDLSDVNRRFYQFGVWKEDPSKYLIWSLNTAMDSIHSKGYRRLDVKFPKELFQIKEWLLRLMADNL